MTDPIAHTPAEAAPPPPGVSRRDWRRVIGWARVGDYALEGVSVGLVVVAAIGFGGYAGRRALVGELAEAYLSDRGVQSEIEVLAVDARGFIGRVRLGPAADPDFQSERVEVLLAAPPPPEGPYALRPRTIRVVAPQLKARWTGERFSLGELDPLIEEALSRPPEDDRPGPRVIVESGALRLLTPYGLVAAKASGVVDDSRLERLDLRLRPAQLEGRDFAVDLRAGTIRARVVDQSVQLDADVALAELTTSALETAGARVTLTGRAPYPDTEAKRVDGPVDLSFGFQAADAAFGGTALRGPELNLSARGAVAGPLARLGFTGGLDLTGRSDALRAGDVEASNLRSSARLTNAHLTLADSALSGRAAVRATLAAQQGRAGETALTAASAGLTSAGLTFAFGEPGVSASGPLAVTASADRVSAGEVAASGLRLAANSNAAALRDGRLTGLVRATMRADSASAPQGRASRLEGEVATSFTVLSAPAPVSGQISAGGLQLAADAPPLTLSDARLRFDGRAGPGMLALNAGLQGKAALPPAQARRLAAGLPIVGDSPGYAAAIARALGDLRVDAPGLRLAGGALSITAPVRLRGPDGAQAELVPDRALSVGPAGPAGGFRLAVRGGGLPDISADVTRLALRGGDVTAEGRVRAALDIPLAEGAVVEARGTATTRNGAFAFAAADCVRVQAARVELGENDVEAVSARLCPEGGAPLVQTGAAGYRIRGRFAEAAALVPFLQARTTAAAGVLDARGGEGGMTAADVRIASAEVTDTAPERRFHPVALGGTASLGRGTWRAALDILDAPAGTRIAQANLQHDTASGAGGVDIAAPQLRFATEGLQPHDLTPLAAGVVSKVDGEVDFTGRIAWAEGALPTSTGRLVTDGLSLDGPLGRVVGLDGELQLSSLTPLVAPPGQVVTAERIEAFTPITDVRAEVGFNAEALQLGSATFRMAGGQLAVEPLRIPFAEDRTLSGAVRLDDVDLGQLIESTGFADKVEITAVVDGRIPFQTGPAGLRFAGGELRSVKPGRVSIAREALTQVTANGAPEAVAGAEGAPVAPPPPNAFQDFAYQALENLAYNELEVSVDSRPEGRLGMIFSIKGRHDPPVEQRARIGLFDLLRGRAFERRIPLPSNTPVNLTLDTSLNFDELLQTWLDLQRDRSAPVQSAPATTKP